MTNLRTISNRTSSGPVEYKHTYRRSRNNGMRSATVSPHRLGFDCVSQLGTTLFIIDGDSDMRRVKAGLTQIGLLH